MTDINPELIERVVQAQAGHFLRVAPVHCTCGWRSGTYSEPDGFARLKAHMAELAISAVADDLRAEALEDMARFANRVYSNSLVPRTLILGDLRERAAKLRGTDQ